MPSRELGMTRKDLEAMLGGLERVQEWGHSECFVSPAYRLAEETQNVPLSPPCGEDSIPYLFETTRNCSIVSPAFAIRLRSVPRATSG